MRKESHIDCFSPQVNCLSVFCGIYTVKAYSFLSLQREMLQATADHSPAVRESYDGFSIQGIILTRELQEINSNSNILDWSIFPLDECGLIKSPVSCDLHLEI